MVTRVQITVDCHDPAALSEFWADALGYRLDAPPAGYATWPAFLQAQGVPEEEWNSASACSDPDGPGPRLFFQRVEEHKEEKNRLHLDLDVGGGHGASPEERTRRVRDEAQRLVGLGAQVLRERSNSFGEQWTVLSDPEGNEFCLQ